MPLFDDITAAIAPYANKAKAAVNQVEKAVSDFGKRLVPGVSPGAMPTPTPATQESLTTIDGVDHSTSVTSGSWNELSASGIQGIIFPYTPVISVEYKAEYTATTPLHSNFAIQSYKNSSISDISIQGKFSVQSNRDAEVYISTMRLLKALTRMRSGGYTGDMDSGSPPPVCRLFAHGEWMFNNVPIAIKSFRTEFNDSVDYFRLQQADGTETAVPTMSTLSITCVPMYSRDEMLKFSVTGYLNNSKEYNAKGYL